MPDPSVPPGHTLMPREERLQTLASLQTSEFFESLPWIVFECKCCYLQGRLLKFDENLYDPHSTNRTKECLEEGDTISNRFFFGDGNQGRRVEKEKIDTHSSPPLLTWSLFSLIQ